MAERFWTIRYVKYRQHRSTWDMPENEPVLHSQTKELSDFVPRDGDRVLLPGESYVMRTERVILDVARRIAYVELEYI